MTITFQREELFDAVWTTPLTSLAKKYGMSDNGVRKICKAMNIPLPKAGHWAKAAVGKAPPRPSLPASADRTTFESRPAPKSETPTQVIEDDQSWLEAKLLEEKEPRNRITFESKPTTWHPAVLPLRTWLEGCVAEYRRAIAEKERREKSRKRSAAPDFLSWDIHRNAPVLGSTHRAVAMRVSLGTYERALAIFNSLTYAAGDRGFRVELAKANSRLRLSFESADVDLCITELLEQRLESVISSWDSKPRMENKMVATGKLRLNVDRGGTVYQINESADSPIEGDLNRVFELAYRYVIKSRDTARAMEIRRREAEVARIRWEELTRQREAEEQRSAEERKQREELLQQAAGLDKAESIRRLVDALTQRFSARAEVNLKFKAWQSWALEVAATHDPVDRLFELLREPSSDQD